ncbi:VOC family protein [Planktotalea sp.]|uniref:VOC family protein n=1 Tax=Planktotalea sp. TaxID=2029877 RepID=UPI003D6C35C2
MTKLSLDHLAVSGENRDAARAHIEDALGLPMQDGGAHEIFGTHNHLMGLADGLYLEAISIDPNAEQPARPRWFDLDNFAGAPRLSNWICSTQDLASSCQTWPEAGGPVALRRAELRWQMAVPQSGVLPFDGLFPPLIEWSGPLHPTAMLEPTGAKLVALTIRHPDADALRLSLGEIHGANVRFETSRSVELISEFETPHGMRVLA